MPQARHRQKLSSVALLLGMLLLGAHSATAQQSLGHKLLGGIGIDAGVQSNPGLYLGDRFVWYGATTITDRNGNDIPIPGLDLDAYADVLGLGYTRRPPNQKGAYLSFAAGAPYAKVLLRTDDPRSVLDAAGFGDVFVQPIKAGWRWRSYDAVAQYEFYAPTGHFEPRTGKGIGRGYWTHQFSIGGAAFRDRKRGQRASFLASYDLNTKKRGIDIRRGNTVQIQGGAGTTVLRAMTVGIAGFAMWQVTADVGADIPPVLRDLKTRDFGVGPEISFLIPSLNMRAEMRYEWEFGGRARPQGGILALGVGYRLWEPRTVTSASR